MAESPSPHDDASLLAGDAHDFAAFYRRHEDAVLSFFLRRTGGADLAADLTAETFARALAGRQRFDPAIGDAGAWLFGIARNLLATSLQRGRVDDSMRRRLGFEPLTLDDEAIARINELDGYPAVNALDELPPAQRAAVVGRVIDEQSYPELARRLECSAAAPALPRVRRWRRRGTPLLAGLVSVVVAGGAIASATGLLDSGDPVAPAPKRLQPTPTKGSAGFTLASVRAPDPDGGPQWAIGTYDATLTAPAPRAPRDIAPQFHKPVTCVVVGRVQDGRLGVIGRDGVFGNDGRFHELVPAAQSSSVCGGRARDGAFISLSSVPPIPASGYTGPPGTAIGGCRERVDLDGPTVSPQTRRKLRGVPQCSTAGLRHVVAGFAGPRAASATLTGPGYRKTLKLQPRENGAYLFVMRASAGARPRLSITDRSGTVCEPFAGNGCPALFQDG